MRRFRVRLRAGGGPGDEGTVVVGPTIVASSAPLLEQKGVAAVCPGEKTTPTVVEGLTCPSAPKQLPMPAVPPFPADRFTDMTMIGKGSFGQIFRAIDRQAKTSVAIKRIERKHAVDVAREVGILRQLQTQCRQMILCFRGLYADDALFHLVTEFVAPPYRELRKFIEKDRAPALNANWVVPAIVNLVRGLRQIHSAGIAHRDIKPENVMVNPLSGAIKYLDFGIACRRYQSGGRLVNDCPCGQLADAPACACEEYGGTPEYLAPGAVGGCIRSLVQHQKADVWALGATLWELLSGQPLVLQCKRLPAGGSVFCQSFSFADNQQAGAVDRTLQAHIQAHNDRARKPGSSLAPVAPFSLRSFLELDPNQRSMPNL
jgi:serine/threonine protein kinase